MRTTLVLASMLWSGVAAAQEAAQPKMELGASGTIWIPQSDAEDIADTSIGVRPHFSYRVHPYVAIVSAFDFVFVNEDDGVADVTYYSISAGARLRKTSAGALEPYGELLLGWHSVDTDGFDDTNLGFRLGGGITYKLGRLVATAGLGYNKVSFDTGFFGDIDVDAFVIEVGLAARL